MSEELINIIDSIFDKVYQKLKEIINKYLYDEFFTLKNYLKRNPDSIFKIIDAVAPCFFEQYSDISIILMLRDKFPFLRSIINKYIQISKTTSLSIQIDKIIIIILEEILKKINNYCGLDKIPLEETNKIKKLVINIYENRKNK